MKLFDKTTLKFIIVGIVNTIVGTGIMFFLYNVMHASYWVSSACNYIFGSILSYFLNKYFTFQNKEKSVRQMVYFVINITVCYLIAYGVAQPLVKWLLTNANKDLQNNIAMLVGMCLFVGLNYMGQRFFVFKNN